VNAIGMPSLEVAKSTPKDVKEKTASFIIQFFAGIT
jgi:hypothetical protein